jgi:hypothetical protein
LDTGEKVLEFVTPFLKPDQFATKVVAICKWLSWYAQTCKLAWELNGPGNTFGDKVIALRYHNVYVDIDSLDFAKKRAKRPGWNPNKNGLLLDKYRSSLAKRGVINRSGLALEECREFIYTATGVEHKANRNRKIDPSGATLNHGDRVIADALFALLVGQYTGESTVLSKPRQDTSVWSEVWEDEPRGTVLYPGSRRC